jgi:hypothetical protein
MKHAMRAVNRKTSAVSLQARIPLRAGPRALSRPVAPAESPVDKQACLQPLPAVAPHWRAVRPRPALRQAILGESAIPTLLKVRRQSGAVSGVTARRFTSSEYIPVRLRCDRLTFLGSSHRPVGSRILRKTAKSVKRACLRRSLPGGVPPSAVPARYASRTSSVAPVGGKEVRKRGGEEAARSFAPCSGLACKGRSPRRPSNEIVACGGMPLPAIHQTLFTRHWPQSGPRGSGFQPRFFRQH